MSRMIIMGRFREKMTRFMYGRYGMDDLSKLIMYAALVLIVANFFANNIILYSIAIVAVIYTYYRILSRNISRRYSENQAYVKLKYMIIGKFNALKFRIKDQKTHRIFKCPGCSQKIRVPKGKGKIMIKCPKCRIEFTRKS